MEAPTRDRALRLAGVGLRDHPHPGQHFKHGWIPIAPAAVAEVLTPDEAARDYGDELDRVEFPNGAAVVARSEGMLTIQSDAGDKATIHAAPSPSEAQGWADYIEEGLDLDVGEVTVEDGLMVSRTGDGLSLRFPEGLEPSDDPDDHDGFDLTDGEAADFAGALRDMGYITEDNASAPDEEDVPEPSGDETPIPDEPLIRHRTLQLLGFELRAPHPKPLHYKAGTVGGKGGQFMPLKDRVLAAIAGWGGSGDPLATFSQPQLKAAATQLGLNPPKGMKLVPLKALILARMPHAGNGHNAPKPSAAPKPKVTTKKIGTVPAGMATSYAVSADGVGVGAIHRSSTGTWFADPAGSGSLTAYSSRKAAIDALTSTTNAPAPPGPTSSVLTPPPAGAKFELLKDAGLSGDGYAPGGQWGHYGAAGVLIRSTGGGEPRFLLVQRGPGVTNNKGKWQLPGGALNSKENPYQGAARETIEEVGAPESYLGSLKPVGENVYTHEATGWQYTTIAADSPDMFDPSVDGSETSAAKWFTAAEIEDMRSNGDLVPKLDKSLIPIIESYPSAAKKPTSAPKPGTAVTPAQIWKTGNGLGLVAEGELAGAKVRVVGVGGGKFKVESQDSGGWWTVTEVSSPEALKAEFPQQAWYAAKPAAPPSMPAGAKKVPFSISGVSDAYSVSVTPKPGTFGPAKQSQDIYQGGVHLGTLHQWSYGWTAESATGVGVGVPVGTNGYVFTQNKATKADAAKALIGHHAEKAAAEVVKKAAAEAAVEKAARAEAVSKLLAPPKPASLTPAEKAVRGGDFSALKQVSGAQGSNEGGVFEAPDGSRWYVKAQKSAEHAANEALASAFYREAGIAIPEVIQGSGAPGMSGSHHTATKILPDVKSDLKSRINGAAKGVAADRKFVRAAHEGFALDTWLANWDAAGLTFDNIVSLGDQPVRIDAGGSLLFRAQGTPKGSAFGPQVTEWDSFTDKESTRPAAALFDSITSDDMIASAARVKAITPAKIRSMVKAHGLDPPLAETLIERRKDILSRAKLEAKKPKKPFAEGALTEEAALHAVPINVYDAAATLQGLGVPKERAAAVKAALHSYKGSAYTGINRTLLGLPMGSALDTHYSDDTTWEDLIDRMDDGFAKAGLNADIVVYRGERNPSRSFPPGEWSPVGGMEGKEWTFKAYASTSTRRKAASSFAANLASVAEGAQPTIMRIVVPKGTAAIALDNSAAGEESEVLLDRGLRYRVVKDNGVTDGVRHLDVMVV